MADMPIEYAHPTGDVWAIWRWADIPSSVNEGQVYLRRLRVVTTPWFSLMVHWINEPDTGRWPHDHPWWFASWVVQGEYTEDLYDAPGRLASTKTHQRGSIHWMPFELAHRITSISEGLVTVVLTGKRRRRFRFWTPEGKIPWDKMQPSEVNDVE
jgi:hypothetical protein